MRIMSYDRAANERNAIPGLKLLGKPLQWYRLDDGVMGGQSETLHQVVGDIEETLHFTGQINTQGGGFCSIRSPVEGGLPSDTTAIRVSFQGDGKTYKFLLSDGNKAAFGPSRRSPSWQADLPTKKDGEETTIIPLSSLTPSVIGGPVSTEVKLDPTQVKELGFMLSLKLSNGEPNPVETFGSGIFPFSLKIRSIEAIRASEKA
ncbi:hypothetical protein HJC23_009846 [Cyclotella cryptica]|uniref:NADH:ubiquinone oxidoreductase intermediate-associated protein 30 domain-containing protein n=1 Tax=Cyclotella cryptica TaxID=29204 RepID=A0ABD3NSD5_9STRA